MDKNEDVLGRYRNISNKLKKKFLRKPNVSEGIEHFGALSKTLKSEESFQYAAFCCLAQARCEHTLANWTGEAQCLVEAARGFLLAEETASDCPGFNEHLNAAVNCYSHAIRVNIENRQPALAASLCLEVGHALKKFGKNSDAIQHFERAAQLQSYSMLDSLSALGLVASTKLETSEYEGALAVLTKIVGIIRESCGSARPQGAFCDILAQAQITQLLILLYIQPNPQRIHAEHAKVLEQFTWDCSTDDNSPTYYLEEDLYLSLQSVVLACQSKDFDSLRSLQLELWPQLRTEQNQLLQLLIMSLEQPPGEGF